MLKIITNRISKLHSFIALYLCTHAYSRRNLFVITCSWCIQIYIILPIKLKKSIFVVLSKIVKTVYFSLGELFLQMIVDILIVIMHKELICILCKLVLYHKCLIHLNMFNLGQNSMKLLWLIVMQCKSTLFHTMWPMKKTNNIHRVTSHWYRWPISISINDWKLKYFHFLALWWRHAKQLYIN